MTTAIQTMQDIVYGFAATPTFAADGICFAARTSGLYRSQDGGATWCSAYDSLHLATPLVTTAVAVSPGFPARDGLVLAGAPGGILRSEDSGLTWSSPVLPAPAPLISALLFAPGYEENGTAFAATSEDGILLSTDRGRTWTAWNFGLLDYHVLCLAASPAFVQDQTLFVGTETGIFASRNGGRSWSEVDLPSHLAPVISLAVSPQFSEDRVLYAGTEAEGMFVSEDCGRTWRAAGTGIAGEPVNAILLSLGPAARNEMLVLSGTTIKGSRNQGETWQTLKRDESQDRVVTCIAAPGGLGRGNPLLIGLSDGGVQRLAL